MRIEPVLQKTCSFTRQNKLTGSQRVSLRTPSSKNLHSCTAQRSRERWGIPPGGGRSGWTPPAGWWRSQSELLRSSWGRTVLSGAPAFYRSTGRRHTTVLSNKNAVYCLLLKALQNHFQRWNLTDHLNTPCLCLHLCVHTSSGSWKKIKQPWAVEGGFCHFSCHVTNVSSPHRWRNQLSPCPRPFFSCDACSSASSPLWRCSPPPRRHRGHRPLHPTLWQTEDFARRNLDKHSFCRRGFCGC